jgi:hypothetical protein
VREKTRKNEQVCVGGKMQAPALRAASLHEEVTTYLHWSVKLGKNVHLSEKALSAPFYEVPYVQYLPKSSGYIAARQTEKRQYRALTHQRYGSISSR